MEQQCQLKEMNKPTVQNGVGNTQPIEHQIYCPDLSIGVGSFLRSIFIQSSLCIDSIVLHFIFSQFYKPKTTDKNVNSGKETSADTVCKSEPAVMFACLQSSELMFL